MTATVLPMKRRRAVRRVRSVTQAGQVRRVHLEVRDPSRGWLVVCQVSATSMVVVDDEDPGLVSCRRCANSGLVPPRWLPATLNTEASR